MNRKQRRAAHKQNPPAVSPFPAPNSDLASALLAEALHHQRHQNLDGAMRAYKRLLKLKPDHAQVHNNLGVILQAQGKRSEASAHFARALTLTPQLFDQYDAICAAMQSLLPPLRAAIAHASRAWPARLDVDALFGTAGLAAIADDPLLLCVMQSLPVRDIGLERLLTALRAALLVDALAGKPVDNASLAFCCTLAQQCFINDYVFADTPEEGAQVDQLKATLAAGRELTPTQLAALAMYQPLHTLSDAPALLERDWPACVDDVLTQQLREPEEERRLRASIPRLTPIDNDVSQRVRQQYEENPYPRWIHAATAQVVVTIDEHLRRQFPSAAFRPLNKDGEVDILVAGCGTGRHPIEVARTYKNARVLAIDLSLTSLCYARRRTPADVAERIDYAQADILKLGSLDRRFDVIDTAGVLHHMADWREGWRSLLPLLKPNGLMHLGLYSEKGRSAIVAARNIILARGYGTTPTEIRRCRQDLIDMSHNVTRIADFFSTSECRDLLLHVQEARVTIPEIKTFLTEEGLHFLGFEFERSVQQHLYTLFAQSGWSLTDLDRWHDLESAEPNRFTGMYQFWVQKQR